MYTVTEADREAARALRATLADISGFWYRIEDDGPLATALARHRVEAEQRLVGKLTPVGRDARPVREIDEDPGSALHQQRIARHVAA